MIDGCGNDELARCMDCGLEKAGEDLENCGMCEEGWKRALKRLAAYEDTGLEPEDVSRLQKDWTSLIMTIDEMGGMPHLCELYEAEKEGRIKILPQSESGTCGSCGHFKRIPGRRCGTCEVRAHWTNRRGQIDEHRGVFTPSQSRKACKQYFAREEAEAALGLDGGANMTDGAEKPYDPDWKKCMMQKFVGRR